MARVRIIPASAVAGWEARLREAVQRALTDQLTPARRHLGLTAAGAKPAAGALAGAGLYGLWSQSRWQKALVAYVEPEVTAIEREAAAMAADAIGSTATWGFALSGSVGQAIMDRATSTGAWIGDRLDVAGGSADAMTAIGDVLSTADIILADQIGAMAQSLANSASNELMDYVTTGDPINYSDATHTWNSMDDDRTREWHADADGQEQPVGEPFSVMGEDMMYPGDPAGSDENTINCRCWEDVSGSAMEQPSAIEDYTGTPAYASPAG